MARTFIGGLVAGIILFLTGYIFWATPLGEIPISRASDAQHAAVQTALNANLTEAGTGTYIIPNHQSAPGAVLYAQGPIATVHFTARGYSPEDMSMLLPGFIFAIVSGLLIAFGLGAVSRGKHFADLAQLVVLFSIGVTAWTLLAQPVFNHYGWGYWIYSFIAETTALILAGLVVARWFVPRDHIGQAAPETSAAPAAPVRSEPEAG